MLKHPLFRCLSGSEGGLPNCRHDRPRRACETCIETHRKGSRYCGSCCSDSRPTSSGVGKNAGYRRQSPINYQTDYSRARYDPNRFSAGVAGTCDRLSLPGFRGAPTRTCRQDRPGGDMKRVSKCIGRFTAIAAVIRGDCRPTGSRRGENTGERQ